MMNNSENEARWVLWPDPNPDDNGYRACIVTENEPGYQRLGRLSNSPADPPPLYIGETQDEADRWCRAWNKERFGYSEGEQRLIVLSSMRQQDLKVTYCNEHYAILLSGAEVLSLDDDECKDLMRQLYKLLWPHSPPECSSCGELLEGFECPNEECPACPGYQECPQCSEGMIDGRCVNQDCPSSMDTQTADEGEENA